MNYLSPQIEAHEKRRKKNSNTLVRTDKSCGIFQHYKTTSRSLDFEKAH